MCAFKKPSTPSYGVKLFVSLVLLAISLCLVNCTATAVPADEARLEIKKTEVVNKLTELVGPIGNKKFSEHNPGYDVKTAFPTAAPGKPEVITPASSGVGGVTPVPTEFKVLLPVDKNIGDYIAKVVKPLDGIADKSSTNVNGLIQTELAKDAHTLVPSVASTNFTVTKNFKELGVILANEFEFDASSHLQKKSVTSGTAVAGADKHLFEYVFGGSYNPATSFNPIVYTDKATAKAFVDECILIANADAGTTNYADAADALKRLLDVILGKLQESTATSVHQVNWSDVMVEIEKVGFKSATEIGAPPATGSSLFKQSDINCGTIASPDKYYDKFYLKVELNKFGTVTDDDRFITYLNANIDGSAASAAAFPALVTKAFGFAIKPEKQFYDPSVAPADGDGFHHVVKAKISDLIAAIDAKLGDYELLKFVDADIAPASSPFSVDSATSPNLVCPNFPVAKPTSGPASATIAEFEKYVKFVLGKFTKAGDNTKIKTDFLALLWAKTNLDAYKATLTTPAAAPATTGTPDATTITPVAPGATGGADAGGIVKKDDDKTDENNDKEEEDVDKDSTKSSETQEAQNKSNTSGSTQSENDYMWIVWAVVGVVAAAIVAAAGYFLWKRKKNASNL